jgi:unsaturated chondroitin disaccharide hydrolase
MPYSISSSESEWVNIVYEKLLAKISQECDRMGDKIPYIANEGKYIDYGEQDISFWTNGFWAGILWQMYAATGDEKYRKSAVGVEQRLDVAMIEFNGLHHDVGFMWLHTAVANYRLTGNETAKLRALHAANLLTGRYNLNGRYISAWNENRPGWMIIDCLMNLPLLYWAAEESQDPRYTHIANSHIDTTIKLLIRPDGSAHHIAVLDPMNGQLLEHPTGQGYASGSSWSRGQAWTIYGFAMNYHHTGDPRYLDIAKSTAHYFLANISQTGYIPRVDFRAPTQPEQWDTTAGVCAACGMLELSKHVEDYEKQLYINGALSILRAIEENYCDWNVETDGIVGGGTVAYHREEETNVPIIYGDYFLLEAITRLKGNGFFIW